jgi:adenosylhomocysteine nucleosidase
MADLSPILVVTGMAREARIASGPGVVVVQAGGSPTRLRALLGTRDKPNCRAVVSFGIAGGLDPKLVPGDVLVATGLVTRTGRLPADPRLVELLAGLLRSGDLRPAMRDLLGADDPVLHPTVKSALHAETGAGAVDMESHVAMEYAARHGLPFAAVRVVCDPAERALPGFVTDALKPDGGVALTVLLRSLARQPMQLGALMQLASDARTSFRALSRCRAAIGAGLGAVEFGPTLGHLV